MTTAYYSFDTHVFFNQLADGTDATCNVCESGDTLLQLATSKTGAAFCSDCVFEVHGVEKTIVVVNNAETTKAFAEAQQAWLSDVAESRAERAADGL